MQAGRRIDPRLCVLCRGRGLCGLSYCPVIVRAKAVLKLSRVAGRREFFGSTPPSVFIGWRGYPEVYAGPSLPPERGDTRIYDYPEGWLGLDLDRILEYRLSLATAYSRVKVTDPEGPLASRLQELALSSRPVDVEVVFEKPPKPRVYLSEYEPPLGPRAPLKAMTIAGNPWVPRPVERLYSDYDARASEAILELYRSGIPVSTIQRLLSVGALGRRRQRRLVPTRWSITAVDSIVSEALLEEVKGYPEISDVEVYVRRWQGNLFIAILVPGKWSYEWMEAWWPGSTWNPRGTRVVVEGDHEGYHGRRDYPSIGGCYYAARLAVAEHLKAKRRQAIAVVLREIYSGFNLPVGVWFVRENVRAMLRSSPVLRTSELSEALKVLDRETRLGSRVWVRESRILTRLLRTRRITEYLRRGLD